MYLCRTNAFSTNISITGTIEILMKKKIIAMTNKITGKPQIVESLKITHLMRDKIDSLEGKLISLYESNIKLESELYDLKFRSEGRDRRQASLSRSLVNNISSITSRAPSDNLRIFILSTHDFGNIGDLAIGYAQSTFLKKIFPSSDVYEIPRIQLLSNWDQLPLLIKENDIIVLPGGGNMGDIWLGEESVRRKIISTFTKNKIISFPQSIKFYNDKQLTLSASIYNAHPNLLLAVRDKDSYDLAGKHFNETKIVKTKDIVLSYQYPASDMSVGEAIAIVSRSDKEKNAAGGINKVVSLLNEKSDHFLLFTDTVDEELFNQDQANAAFLTYAKVDQLHTAKLVITDRLHGAIFALHAGRPVIVFDNNYGKIQGALSDLKKMYGGRLFFANDDASNVTLDLIETMYKMGETDLSPADLLEKDFNHFREEIMQFTK